MSGLYSQGHIAGTSQHGGCRLGTGEIDLILLPCLSVIFVPCGFFYDALSDIVDKIQRTNDPNA